MKLTVSPHVQMTTVADIVAAHVASAANIIVGTVIDESFKVRSRRSFRFSTSLEVCTTTEATVTANLLHRGTLVDG